METIALAIATMSFFVIGIFFLFLIPFLVASYIVFKKAGVSGWYALIPIYNTYIMHKLTYGKKYAPMWAIFMIFPMISSLMNSGAAFQGEGFFLVVSLLHGIISIAAYLYQLYMLYNFAKAFGWGTFGAVCYAIFPWIAIFVLAFGKAQYSAPVENTFVQNIADKYIKES